MSTEFYKQLMFWGNLGTGVSYLAIAGQLVHLVNSPQIQKLFAANHGIRDEKVRHLYRIMMAVVSSFASAFCMCGNTHLMNALCLWYPHSEGAKLTQAVIMLICTLISLVTVTIGFGLFPALAEIFQNLELGNDGSIQHSENYMIEVVEMLKESILVLTDDLVVVRCNDISRTLFGAPVVGTQISEYIKESDLPKFKDTIQRVKESYSFVPVTTEVRIRRSILLSGIHLVPEANKPKKKPKKVSATGGLSPTHINTALVHCDHLTTHPEEAEDINALALPHHVSSEDDEDFLWIEVTMCKGKQVCSDTGGFEYDLKLVCRDIDDHKKRQAYQTIIEGTEERDRINESKLQYLSCIAHDLKTPLQSFSFSLDLLNDTDLLPEQREFIQQANVAVDLMKLTISQTMDISKALTGAKLMPRRTTVYLSSVLNRVKIIINGYGKQVPVSFEVAPDVCDEIITDEEWLWQMLLNLLTNACKYTDKGSIHVRISVVNDQELHRLKGDAQKQNSFSPLKGPRASPTMLLCEVIDTGVGISPNKIDHIFDAFAQVQEGQVTGTGLGLFGVRTRAEGLLGTCGARHNTESSTGTGTVLWFAVPYTPNVDLLNGFAIVRAPSTLFLSPDITHSKRVSDSPARSPALLTPSSPKPLRGGAAAPVANSTTTSGDFALATDEVIRRLHLSAMVVEDTASVRKLMERLLLKMGFASVKGYENGSKGLEAMMAAPVDIVFSDVQMPIMTGPEMVSRFRKWEAEQRKQAPFGTSTQAAFSTHVATTLPTARLPPAAQSQTQAQTTDVSRASCHVSSDNSTDFPFAADGTDSCGGEGKEGGVKNVRPRQLIVAVTANGAECGECGENGFDEICPKPLTKTDIYRIVSRFFQ